MLKAVLFDLDNTLLDRDGAFRACVQGDEELLALDQGEPLFAVWRRKSGRPMDQAIFAARLSQQLRPDPGLLAALRSLPCKAIVSNGGGATQRLKLRAAGLEAVFSADCIFLSGELGMEKPDPRLFLHASQCLGVEPGQCLFIGDRDEIDGAGARAAGMRFQLARQVLNGPRLLEMLR